MSDTKRVWRKRLVWNHQFWCCVTKDYYTVRFGLIEVHRGKSGRMMKRLLKGKREAMLAAKAAKVEAKAAKVEAKRLVMA